MDRHELVMASAVEEMVGSAQQLPGWSAYWLSTGLLVKGGQRISDKVCRVIGKPQQLK